MAKQLEKRDEQRLELMRSHIFSGFYNSRDIIEATADSFIRSKALHIFLDRYGLDNHSSCIPNADGAKTTPKIAEIRRKIDDGYYDDPNNLAELVEKLIKRFDFE